jgi:hypothetical protein
MVLARRFSHRTSLLIAFALFASTAAAPLATDNPDELVRLANEAQRAGDADSADRLYATAAERTTDPGLVAYNRAGVLFERKQYREAERHYDRVLDDAACPPARAARAWYNRGTCLLNRGGSIDVYRAAIACFENALDNPAAGPDVLGRAPHNLELAKLLWMEEAKKARPDEPPSPNNKIPEEENRLPQSDPNRMSGEDPSAGMEPADAGATPQAGSHQQTASQPDKGTTQKPADQKVAGPRTLQMIEDKDEVQQLSPEDARTYLQETAKRRKRELRALLDTLYGPTLPGVRDW